MAIRATRGSPGGGTKQGTNAIFTEARAGKISGSFTTSSGSPTDALLSSSSASLLARDSDRKLRYDPPQPTAPPCVGAPPRGRHIV